jgi:hypothetical protein
MRFNAKFPTLPSPIKAPPQHESNKEPTWLILAVSILPAVLPSLIERVGHEVSTYFKRKRIEKARERKKEEREREEKEAEEEEDVIIELTESEFAAALESGHIRILKDEEDDEDAVDGDEEEE